MREHDLWYVLAMAKSKSRQAILNNKYVSVDLYRDIFEMLEAQFTELEKELKKHYDLTEKVAA